VPGTLTFLGFSASKKLVSWMLRQIKKRTNFLVSPPETKIISWGFRQHRSDVASSGARKTKATLAPSDQFFFSFLFFSFLGAKFRIFFDLQNMISAQTKDFCEKRNLIS
jgi:hypothetical protein